MTLKEIRRKKGWTQHQLAAKAQIAQSAVHYIEEGTKSPTLYTMCKIAHALDMEVGSLANFLATDEDLYVNHIG